MIERFSAVVHKIYEGCTDPSAWPGIIAVIAEHLEADKGLLLTPFAPGKEGFVFPHGITQDNIALWSTRYQAEDLWSRRLAERNLIREGLIVFGDELVPDEELLESAWYRDFLARMNIFRLISGGVFGAGDPDLPVTFCSFFRGVEASPFGEPQRALLRLLVPHVSRALGVMFKLRDAEFRVAVSLHALAQIRHGIVLLDEDGGVCFANDAAERILRRQDGLLVTKDTGIRKLTAENATSRAALEHALQANLASPATDASHFAHAIAVRRTCGSASYAVQVSYLPESNPYAAGAIRPRAVVFIKDDSLVLPPDTGLLQRAYGLTQAETRAAVALCDGGSMETVAAQLNIKLNTLKTHLKGVYAKTSVDNRAALTKLLLSLSAT